MSASLRSLGRALAAAGAALALAFPALAAPPASLTDARVDEASGTVPAAALERFAAGSESVWIAWSVPAVAGAANVCCFRRNFKVRGCSLAGENNGWGTTHDGRDGVGGPAELLLFAEAARSQVRRIQLASPSCPIDGAGRRVIWLGAVDAGASLELLGRAIESDLDRARRADSEVAETALGAVAYHADPRADALIERRALDRTLDQESREEALFWAGDARGQAGYRLLDRVLASEPDGDLRQHALFALTQSPVDGSLDRVRRAGIEDRDPEVRGQAMFWLAQENAPGAGEWILARLDSERDEEVREQAVFALSELDDGADWLLRVLRSKRDPEIIRQALFWLGESEDPRALAELEKLLAP